MYDCIESGIFMSFTEICLLLQSLGVTSVNGIYMGEEQISDEEVVEVLDGMVKKGLLTAEEERFVIEERLGHMMRCMGWSEADYPLEYEDGQIFYCYERGQEVLVTSLFQQKGGMMRLMLLGKEEFEEWKERMRDDTCGY